MRLLSTPTSPYARKVRIALREKNLSCEVETVDLRDPAHAGKAQNPLGKIPVLLRNDGEAIYDSAVILQYLELFHPQPPLLPSDPAEKIRCLRLEALADGIMDATIAWVQEHRRSKDCQDPGLLKKQRDKVQDGLAFLQTQSRDWRHDSALDLGQIGAIAAIGYVDLRAPELLVPYVDLHRWYQSLRDRPSVAETAPQ
ncbi:glutathione S-transferase N-terminal domain-containing protein [Acidithiobacillus sp. AMEEHan]|uniref:glutathione S-transferase family protein n=1 Tax=Acidithiobacillus sp. AMEEHan TaxID=2994951 RepID=UPI0027E53CE5|nr:glutathione S-transferase N-terminal domain-containing protein [Acidithiobacillus sp. AMEEHan]